MPALPVSLAALRRAPRSSQVALAALVLGLLVSAIHPLLPRDGIEGTQPFVDALRAKAQELRAGDVVLVHPPWRHDVLDAIDAAGILPKGARATVALALPHGQAPGRVLVLTDPGAPPLPKARQRQLGTTERIGGVSVGWLTSGTEGDAGADLGAQIANARVHVEKADGKRVTCTWDDARDRHVCRGLESWMYVGPTSLLVGGDPARCVWSHPITGGKVVIRFPGVRLGDELTFAHALADSAASSSQGAPVTAALFLDGKRLGSVTRSNRTGWSRKTFKLPEGERPDELRIEITTPNDGARHYCWTLTSATRDGDDADTAGSDDETQDEPRGTTP